MKAGEKLVQAAIDAGFPASHVAVARAVAENIDQEIPGPSQQTIRRRARLRYETDVPIVLRDLREHGLIAWEQWRPGTPGPRTNRYRLGRALCAVPVEAFLSEMESELVGLALDMEGDSLDVPADISVEAQRALVSLHEKGIVRFRPRRGDFGGTVFRPRRYVPLDARLSPREV